MIGPATSARRQLAALQVLLIAVSMMLAPFGAMPVQAKPAPMPAMQDQAPSVETQAAAPDVIDAGALTLVKSASPLTYTAFGQVINFSYLLKNTGTIVLNGPFTVTDNRIPTVNCPNPGTLVAGASITCNGTYAITPADMALGYAVNTATATSTAPDATTSNTDVRIVSIPVTCRNDSDGGNDVPGQKDLTQECTAPTAVNPMVVSWNWDVTSMSGGNSADACALFDTNNNGLANYGLCVSWQDGRAMQAGYPVLYSCTDTRSDRCTGSTPLAITYGSTCALELANDDTFSVGDSYPNDTKAFCSINLADVGGAVHSSLIDVCSYPSAVPNSDPSDCVVITASRGNLEVIKDVAPDDPNTIWNISWTGPTPYTGVIDGDGTTGIQAVDVGNYDITETGGTGTDLSLYDATWACTVDGAASTSGSGTTITGRSVAKGSVVICTFTNTRKTGSLEIKKDVVPDNASTNWDFAVTGPDPAFTSCSIAGDGTCGAKTVFTGSYSILETAGSGTSLSDYGTNWACTVNGAAGPSGTGTTLSGLTINKGDAVVCTFTNSLAGGTLTVDKVVKPSNDPGKFNLLIDGVIKAPDVGNGGTTGAVSVAAGSHTVSESAGTGTDLSNYVTTISGDCNPLGIVSLQPNENKSCTITNTRKGTIIVEKQTDPDGAAGSFTFTGDAAGTIADNGQIIVSNLAPGPYSSTETSLAADFTLESITCDDGSSATASTVDLGSKTATFKLDPGETVKCTFTNKLLYPDLQVTKTADAAGVTAGDAVGFSISVKNNGQGTANNVTLSDTLPAVPGVTWTIASQPSGNPCTLTSNTLSCTFGNLAPGATAGPVHVTGTSAAGSCGTWNNTATAQADNNTAVTGSASIFVDCATIQITKTAASGTVSAGDLLGFTITVSNDNSGTAHNVTASDTLPTNLGLSWTVGGADAGACSITAGVLTCNFGDVAGYGSRSVTLTSPTTYATCGTVSNTARVTTSNDGSAEASASVTVNCPALMVTKTADKATASAGDQIGFMITVSNGGPGVAKNVSLMDSLPSGSGISWTLAGVTGAAYCQITGGVLSCSFGDMAPGASYDVRVTSPTTKDSCATYYNTATVLANNQPPVSSQLASVEVLCTVIQIMKIADVGPFSAGDQIGFTIMVSNPGPANAYGVTATDTLPTNAGLNWQIASQPAGDPCSINSGVLTCNYGTMAANTAKSVHVTSVTTAATCGMVSNNASVTTTNDGWGETGDSLIVNCPALTVTKTADATPVNASDPIGFTITVKNTGLGEAPNAVLSDPLPTGTGINWTIDTGVGDGSVCSIDTNTTALTCAFGNLDPGATKTVHVTSPTVALSCGSYANTATITSTYSPAVTAAATIQVNCPSLVMTKVAEPATINAGEAAKFVITIQNTGAGAAYNLVLKDTLPSNWDTVTSTPAWDSAAYTPNLDGTSQFQANYNSLAAGGTITVIIQMQPVTTVCGEIYNAAQLSASNSTGFAVADATITVNCPAITLAKTAEPTTYAAVGTAITYSYWVTNTGNVTLHDTIVVTDDKVSVSCTPDPNGLASGEYATCTATYTITQADLDAGSVTNTAVASTSHDGKPVTSGPASATVTAIQAPNISLTKSVSEPSFTKASDVLHYTLVATNSGNVTLHNVSITDPLLPNLTCTPAQPATLTPTETLTCTGSYTLTQADIDAGKVDNTATVTSKVPDGSNGPTAQASAHVPITQTPALVLDKTASPMTYDHVGQVITYSYLVTNSGNVTLFGPITVTDNKATVSCPALDIAGLKPGASITCNATYIITQANLDAGSVTNTAEAHAFFGSTAVDSNEDSVTVTAAQNPALTLVKTATPATYSKVGDVISYSYKVTNIGNVTLSGPFTVTDDKATATCPTTASLAPAAYLTCTASYTIKQADLDAGSVTNTAKAKGTFKSTDVFSIEDSETVTAVQSPAISLTKTANPTVYGKAGDVINYTLVAKNTGNVTLHDVSISDSKLGTLTCLWPGTTGILAPNQSVTCTGKYTIQATDLTVFSITNTATVNAKGPKDQPVSATATVTIYRQTGALLPTQTSCQQYAAGPSAWPAMYSAFTYQVKANKISAVSPGVIFYYNTIKAPSASFTLQVVETNSLSWKAMFWQDAGQAILYLANCSKAAGVSVTATGTTTPYTIKYTVTGATPGATYYIGIKYTPANLVGQAVKSPYPTSTYSWSTTGFAGSSASIGVQYKK